ncbi:MAG: hydrogenase formation protein HypD [Selenomonadaceae bacterium]|nr:hydrogenase formation protein HypD [Selenomonadaceae bacterium]
MEDKAKERALAQELVAEIRRLAAGADQHFRFMEVCGTHTVAIFRAGLRQLLPENVELVSGPGCPVCVTPDDYMDKAITYALRDDTIITTFGDMLKVPGSKSSLMEAKASGADIRIVYSPLDTLQVAKENPDKKVIFLAVGFETTAPTAAATVLAAKQAGLTNVYMLSAQKLVPPIMHALMHDPQVKVDGFLLPGHVAVITGTRAFQFLVDEYRKPGVVAGFEPLQLRRAIVRRLQQATKGEARIENEYEDVVRPEGSPAAQKATSEVYEPADAGWRGMGIVPLSGLRMREAYAAYDIERLLPLDIPMGENKPGCRCGEVLRGIVTPKECPLFAKACVPTHAVGPCMVSVEGVCAAWYKYGQGRFQYGK